MAAKTVRVRDPKGRVFTMLAVDARRMGYTVLPEPGVVPGSEPEAPKTSAKPAAEKKSTKAAVIDSESAPTSEGTNR